MHRNTKAWLYGLLRKSEKYTKTDMVYLTKGGTWLGIGQALTIASSFALSIFFANFLPKETYGLYRYVLSILNLLLIPTLAGIDTAVMQAVARGFDATLFDGLKVKMKGGLVGSGISLILGLYYFLQGNVPIAICFFITALFIPFTEAFDIYNSLLNGRGGFSIYTKYNVITQIVYAVAMIIVIIFYPSLYWILATYLISNTLLNAFFLWRTLKTNKINDQRDPEAMRYGSHMSAALFLGTLANELDKILVFHYLGAIELAVYSFSVLIADQIKGVLKNINTLAFPKFAKANIEDLKKSILPKALRFGIIIGFFVLAYILAAPFLFKIFFPKYLASVFYSQILALSVIGSAVAGFIYTLIESQKLQKEMYSYNVISNVISLILLVFFISNFGLLGAVYARLVSRFVSLFIVSVLVYRA